jgi:hypothetical protein
MRQAAVELMPAGEGDRARDCKHDQRWLIA